MKSNSNKYFKSTYVYVNGFRAKNIIVVPL